MNNYDVIIVGAGGAGLMLARELGRNKISTLLLDRKEDLLDFSFYTLGSFMKPGDFDLSDNVIAQDINKAVIHSKRFIEKIDMEGCTLDKRKVHEELLAGINADFVTIQPGVSVQDIKKDDQGNYHCITDKKGNEYHANIFVDASGNSRVFSKKVGLIDTNIVFASGVEYNVEYLGETDEAHFMLGKDYQGGYGWIFPLKNKRAIIGFGSYEKKVIKNLKSRLNHIIHLPNISKIVRKDNEKVEGGSVPLTPVIDKFIDRNLVCVGDSVSQINPIAGEGYKFIFEAALMASDAIVKALLSQDMSVLSKYEVNWRGRFLSNYKRSKKAQERIYKLSKYDSLIDLGMIILKLRSNKKNVATFSGEYQ